MSKKPIRKTRTKNVKKKKQAPVTENILNRQRRFWLMHWKEAAILFIAAIALYARAIPYEFVLDDQIVISDNDFTKRGIAGIDDIFANDSFTGYFGEQKDLVAGSRYRPLSLAVFAIIHEFFGLNERVYHGVNVLLYALLCLIIFRVMYLLFPRIAMEQKWFAAVPMIGAVLYLAHPVHTEAVANIKGCDEILAMIGAMGAFYGAIRYAYSKSMLWLIVSGISFLAGIMAKENTITFLAVIPLAFYFFTDTRPRTWIIATLPSLLMAIVYIGIRYQVIGFLFSDNTSTDLFNNPFLGMTAEQKAATIMYTLGLYVKLLIFPHPLTHDYYPYHIPIMDWSKAGTLLSLLTYVVLGVLALIGIFKKRVFAFAICYFIATISIVSNIFFPIGTFMNERFLFMPSLAYSIVAGYYAARFIHTKSPMVRWTVAGLTILVAGAFFWRSFTRIAVWQDPLTLNTAAVAVSKNSARANCFMGTALFQNAKRLTNSNEQLAMFREGEKYIDRSLSIVPGYYNANQMKSGVISEYYRFDRDLDKLLAGYTEILKRRSNVEYVSQFCEYLNAQNVDTGKLLNFYYHVGYEILTIQQRRYNSAVKYLTYGYQLDPNNAYINFGLGKAYLGMGDHERGQLFLQRAYELNPTLRNQ